MLVLAGAGTGKTAALTARLAHLRLHAQGLAVRDPRRHLHQQGGARDARAGRPDRRRGGRGHALARHLPFDRRQDAAPPCRAGRAQEQFHHPRHRRPAAPAQAADRRRRHRREALAGAPARRADRPLEEQGLDPGPGRCRRGRGLCQRQGRQALRRLPGAAEATQRLRFRRSAAAHAGDPARPTATCSSIYQQRFKYILVDEYQDTNQAQYLWLRLLAQSRKNICCVGDDDQSIYSWRGAEVANILRFEKDFPGAKIIRLEQNYRSTPHILAAASGLIAQNGGRLGKTLWTEEDEGEKVQVIGVWDGPEEARRVGEEIETIQRRGGRARRRRDPGPRPVPDPRVRGPLHRDRPALPDRRRLPLLRARRDPRRARLSARHRPAGRRPRLRADRQLAQARPRRQGGGEAPPARPRRGHPALARRRAHPRHATS